MRRIVLATVTMATITAAGCGGAQAAPSSSRPTCHSLVGRTLTLSMEHRSCTSHGAIQVTADVKCDRGTMVAFGNVVGGYRGRHVHRGNYAEWPGCFS